MIQSVSQKFSNFRMLCLLDYVLFSYSELKIILDVNIVITFMQMIRKSKKHLL